MPAEKAQNTCMRNLSDKILHGEGRKHLEVSMIKYMIFLKCETKYQKLGPNTNLI